jgi:hypothetical protein
MNAVFTEYFADCGMGLPTDILCLQRAVSANLHTWSFCHGRLDHVSLGRRANLLRKFNNEDMVVHLYLI